jgi:predicted nucleic acid-binding protein
LPSGSLPWWSKRSALQAGCDPLWSDDMQYGMTLGDGLRIVNPFRVAS